jgi:glycosyltransferase involved in cell wall biosynthesis
MMADVYKPHVSGVTHYIALNQRYLEKLGHEVFVFTFGNPQPGDGAERVARSPGVPLIDTGYYFSFRYTDEVKALLQSMDIVHVHHPFLSGQLALRYCTPLRIPVVFTNHTRYDLYLQTYLPVVPEGLGETFLQAYLPSFCRAVDLIISPSEGMAAVLRDLGVNCDNLAVIPNGIDLTGFLNVAHPRRRDEFGFDDQHVLLTYVGRIAPEKNLPLLIQSFAGITRAYDHARLLVVGDGPERESLEALAASMGISERVRFTGLVAYDQLPAYLAMADAFVTPSVTEVHPLTVIEAMATGLPVLGIHSPGVADTVVDGVTGLISSDDLAAFTAKMSLLVTEPELRQRMGAAARSAARDYAIEKTAPRVLEQYQRLVTQGARSRSGIRYRLKRAWERRKP